MFWKSRVSAICKLSRVNHAIRKYSTVNPDLLKQALKERIPSYVENVKGFRRWYRNKKVCDVRINQIYEGLSGIQALLNETSEIVKESGVQFRGYPMNEICNVLPIADGNEFPSAEGLFWFFLTAQIPEIRKVAAVTSNWAKRSQLPPHIFELIKCLPKDLPPITKLSCCISALCINNKILITDEGKSDCVKWERAYEEAVDVIAKLPSIVALLYQFTLFKNHCIPKYDSEKDWISNFSTMMGFKDKEFTEFLRLFFILQSDYGGGNVPSHAVHLTGSALSGTYLSLASGINGNTGLMFGLVNNEIINFMQKVSSKVSSTSSNDQVKCVCKKMLKSYQNIPLSMNPTVQQNNDKRSEMLKDFGQKHFPTCPAFQIVKQLDEAMPTVLKDFGNQYTWPSFEACSVAFFQHYRLHKTFYAVLFSMSRALGSLASYVLHLALDTPAERPCAFSTNKYLKLMESLPKKAESN